MAVTAFFEKLKSTSRGYASLDYEITEEKQGQLVKLAIKSIKLEEKNFTNYVFCSANQRSASSAAAHPVPAAVTACLYL